MTRTDISRTDNSIQQALISVEDSNIDNLRGPFESPVVIPITWASTISFWVAAIFVAAASAGEQVIRTQISSSFMEFRWFFVQFLCLLSLAISVLFLLYDVWKEPALRKNVMKNILPKTVVWLAILDTLHSMSLMLAIGVIPSSLTIVLPLALPPVAFLVKMANGGCGCAVFRVNVTFGLVAVFVGIGLCILPSAIQWDSCFFKDYDPNNVWIHCGILLFSLIPAAQSALRKERMMADLEINPNALNIYLSFLQFVIGFVLSAAVLPLQDLTASSKVGPHPFANFAAGFQCLHTSASRLLAAAANDPNASAVLNSTLCPANSDLFAMTCKYAFLVSLLHASLLQFLPRAETPNQVTLTLALGSAAALLFFIAPMYGKDCPEDAAVFAGG